jgi:hypothetical protein
MPPSANARFESQVLLALDKITKSLADIARSLERMSRIADTAVRAYTHTEFEEEPIP